MQTATGDSRLRDCNAMEISDTLRPDRSSVKIGNLLTRVAATCNLSRSSLLRKPDRNLLRSTLASEQMSRFKQDRLDISSEKNAQRPPFLEILWIIFKPKAVLPWPGRAPMVKISFL